MPETRVITVTSPNSATTLTEGTDFYNAYLTMPNPRKVSGRPVYKGNYVFGATDKGAEFTITLNGVYKNFAQKRALETAIRSWNAIAGYTTIKEDYTGGSTTDRTWRGMLISIPINESPPGEGPVSGGKFSLTIILTADPT